MRIVLLEPFHTVSHEAWMKGYRSASAHEVEILELSGRQWKWMMHGGSVAMAGLWGRREPKAGLIVASDMLDLTTFLALTRESTAGLPAAVYFHENQLTYPWSEDDPDPAEGRDLHYGFINIASALAADRVFFNSRYHMDSFIEAAGSFAARMPRPGLGKAAESIRDRCSVLHLGLDLAAFDSIEEGPGGGPPLIIWNHRWEYDKGPEEFFEALFTLAGEGLEFELAVLGPGFTGAPGIFAAARERLGDRIVHFGYAADREEYGRWLKRGDILPVTSVHDFFGASVVEAVYCGCCPVLPRRLAYPEHIGGATGFLYDGFDGLLELLRRRIVRIGETRAVDLSGEVARYDWSSMGPVYDRTFEGMAR